LTLCQEERRRLRGVFAAAAKTLGWQKEEAATKEYLVRNWRRFMRGETGVER
jgi:hypothetical protein